MYLFRKEIATIISSLLETRIKLTLAENRDEEKIMEIDLIIEQLEEEYEINTFHEQKG
jgi:hypothetical protein